MLKKIIALFSLFVLMNILAGCSQVSETVDLDSVNQIFNASEFSRISSEELIEKLGNPISEEEWSNKTSKGDVLLTTYSYDVEGVHYEFVIADDTVVRVSLYSNKYWNNEGDAFKYENDNKEDLRYQFGISEINDTSNIKDNNVNYEISPVSDSVANFTVGEIDVKEKTFGYAKITYNINYFE